MRKLRLKTLNTVGLSVFLSIISQPIFAIQEGWYLGAGYGASHLDPKVPFGIFQVSEHQSKLRRAIAGYDLDQFGSLEFTVTDLGEATLSNDDAVAYSTANIGGLYRIYDTQDSPNSNQNWGINLFAKLGLGYLQLDSETALESESRVNMMVGAGAEFSMIGGLSLRAELEFLDTDVLAGNISLLKRFRFPKKQPKRMLSKGRLESSDEEQATSKMPPNPTVEPAIPVSIPKRASITTEPTLVEGLKFDADADGVADKDDRCQNSKVGFPVRSNGCGILNGVLSDLKFAKYSSDLTESTKGSLRSLAKLLKKYPLAAVRLGAHTTDEGAEASQLTLTRDRIRAIGGFLARLGVPTSRIKFMAYGAKVPLNGRTVDRIDIKELN